MNRRWKTSLLLCLLVLLLCACHSTAGQNDEEGLKIWKNSWKKNAVVLLHEGAEELLYRVKAYEGNVVWSTTDPKSEYFYYISKNKQDQSNAVFAVDMGTAYVLDYCLGNDGSIFFLILEYPDEEENIYLKKYTSEGQIVTVKCMNDFHGGGKDDCYKWKVLQKPDGCILVYSQYAYLLLQEDGDIIKEDSWENPENFELTYIDEESAVGYWCRDYKPIFCYFNLKTGERHEYGNIQEWQTASVIKCANGKVCICTTTDLCCIDPQTHNTESLIRWSDFGMLGDNICGLYEWNKEIHCILYDNGILYGVTYQQEEDKVAKTEIRLACFRDTAQLREAVAAFNRESSECVVVVEEYYDEDEATAVQRLYNEVLTGNAPDIISFSSDYANDKAMGSKGMLEDLTPYLQNSNVINKENIVDSVYQSLLVDERLYMLPTNFALELVITKDKWAGKDGKLDCKELLQGLKETEIQVQISREKFLRCGAMYGGYSLEPTDLRLESYIEVASKLPDEVGYQPDDSVRRNGGILLEPVALYDVNMFLAEKSMWGEDVVFTGFPETEGNGMAFWPINCFGINSRSGCKDEAWSFIESFFTAEWQQRVTPNWCFSVSKDVLDRQLMDSMKRDYYYDEDGILCELPVLSYELDGEKVNVYASEEENIASLRKIIDETEVMRREDSPIVNIVQEETAYYFDGKKTLDETIGVIRNRAYIYEKQ